MGLSRGSKLDGVPKLVQFQPIPTPYIGVRGDEMTLRTDNIVYKCEQSFKKGYLYLSYEWDLRQYHEVKSKFHLSVTLQRGFLLHFYQKKVLKNLEMSEKMLIFTM